ncbi:hypothetical protein B0I37DRAFT_20766 [Chaetomium sp. MPI-CAGE-AT-0009]|nr:hypothetical protein B0I37DRAFT_20766 [Chaetomium sp. MPI-CAGE-AT-0009]
MPNYIKQLPLPSLPVGDFSTITPLFRATSSHCQQGATPLPPTFHNATAPNPPFFNPTAPTPYHSTQFTNTHPSSSTTNIHNSFTPQSTHPNPDQPTQHHHHHHQTPHHRPSRPSPPATARRWLLHINAIPHSALGDGLQLPRSRHATTEARRSASASADSALQSPGGGHSHSRTPSAAAAAAAGPYHPHLQQHQHRRLVKKQRERGRDMRGGGENHRGLVGGFRALWHRG